MYYLLGFFGFSYFYRHTLKRLLIRGLYFILTHLVMYTHCKNDDFKKIESKKIDDYHLHKYNLVLDNKKHIVSFMSECEIELSDQLDHFKKTLKDTLQNKHYIVHCSIMDFDDNIYIDLTDTVRHFFYYFDKLENGENANRVIKLKAFFRYIEDIYGTLLDTNKYQLVLYMNDNHFTEYKFQIKDILDKTFGELFEESKRITN